MNCRQTPLYSAAECLPSVGAKCCGQFGWIYYDYNYESVGYRASEITGEIFSLSIAILTLLSYSNQYLASETHF